MRRFRFYAIGEGFDVNLYLSQYKIDYSRTWDKDYFEHSGLVKYLGDEYLLSSCRQEEIAYSNSHSHKAQ